MDETRNPSAQDITIEAAVLRQLLALHPTQLTVGELAREIGGETADFAQTDAVERAVRELAAAGLLHRIGDIVIPSRAALRLDALLG
jgi:response regulator RpfG family c-di-GMP phosphodiesterase